MARNEEKALTLFSKWTTFKKDFHSTDTGRRPFLASECESVTEAEKWRRELIRDITKKISNIHNASLGEHRIREMNDEINKMMRQKHHWEVRIRELGGDVQKGRQFYDIEGKELPGAPGYKYYGAAKELPGVRELFAEGEEEVHSRRNKRSRGDMYKNITPDYYGYRDDDDGILAIKEAKREKELLAKAEKEYAVLKADLLKRMRSNKDATFTPQELALLEDDGDDEETEVQRLISAQKASSNGGSVYFPPTASAAVDAELKSHVNLPSQTDINELLLAEKRKALLARLSNL
uniref:Pre-mRNA-splicing factor ISY1 n=2 Tax=Spumella elongata TaxID=89044 RepID=A0A7S3M565_9STRA|mmetsp:Transcript_32583/g.55670  ORF Transcript_32583/g.55670 Transcript_32583/m.55670 type:complete len:292 (+) Transcript_32583:91-966(+)|eukprot:CAMPEP_0184988766 /NCGR_PEP_ID=MMETSP1098-20130426/25540_1 /TAXON_ID=89044 /ORGANISM="Spumella elongata, Strain CCAP 955/1" /LENGTH=291 /DNA_ID=CAMNT_0027513605 /DNA_START=74 /DNA_END=949 /DNA_ORIENTATION=+